jgi:DNA-binding response OmpR family regulator
MEKVLCVDDDLSLLRLYHDELTEEGYRVILAEDGKEALMKFENPLT